MRLCEDRDQCDRETKTGPASHGVNLTLVEFWRDQLNRVKEYAESQAIKLQVTATSGPGRYLLGRYWISDISLRLTHQRGKRL